MRAIARYDISTGPVGARRVIPKGTPGQVVAITERIAQAFPGLKEQPTGSLYLVKFPELPELLVGRDQVTVTA